MARTKAEIIAFLDTLVGRIPQHPAPFEDLSGQCVTGVKVLMDFIGVPNPYQARGNAKDAGDTLLRQGIAEEGLGWLNIVVNRTMGNIGGTVYGHIWIQIKDGPNYESNGARALYMTKNTRPLSQGQQFINLDKYVTEENTMTDKQAADMAQAIGLALMFSVEQIYSPWWFNAKERAKTIKADPYNYPTTLLLDKEVGYNSPHFKEMLHKAVHYDADVKSAYERGKAEAGTGGPKYRPVAQVDGKATLYELVEEQCYN